MAILDILHFPDPRLRQIAQPVRQVDARVQTLVDDMLETMYEAPGVGLAAPQVNVLLQVLVIDISETRDHPLCLINPEIVQTWGEKIGEEGCLSVPGFYDQVPRAERIRVRALGRDGVAFECTAEGLLAVCIQHEMDHLQGRLFVDYLSTLKRFRIRKKLEKDARQRQNPPLSQQHVS